MKNEGTKTVLITGSSTGIGRATALLFQKQGWNVIATMRTPEREKELTKLERVICPRLDVMDSASIRSAIEEGIRAFGKIDAVVNNAGYGLVGAFEASNEAQIRRQFDTNVFGLMAVTREILPYFRAQRSGTIANVASVGGRITFPLYSLYHGTKWAVEGFSEGLSHEVAPFGIRVRIIEPGPIKTDFYDRSQDLMKREGLTAYDNYIARHMPNLQNAGSTGAPPEAVAKTVYKSVTDRSSRLRYAPDAQARALLLLRRFLPDGIFNSLVRFAVSRPAKAA